SAEGGVPLDCVSLDPLTSPDSTAFIDPATVLRAAQIIPRFPSKKIHPGGRGISNMARDSSDWNQYYVNRYADRDMFMRYHIGMGVGHQGVWKKLDRTVSVLPPHAVHAASPHTRASSDSSPPHPGSIGENESTSITADIGSGVLDGCHGGEGGGDEEFQLDSDMEVDEEASVEGDDDYYERDIEMFGLHWHAPNLKAVGSISFLRVQVIREDHQGDVGGGTENCR
ncbi:hypothetical protein FA13DRAFT_1721257, partial [Coprinellus micaceus]